MIGVLVFLAIAIPLLVICLDENKKKKTLAKLGACWNRLSKVRLPRPRVRLPHPRPRPPRQRPQSTTPAHEQARVTEPPAPEPASPEPQQLHTEPPEAPPITKTGPPVDPELSKANDEPPPYPGGPGPSYNHPPLFAATIDYQGYPPPWSDSAYPPSCEVPNSLPYPDN